MTPTSLSPRHNFSWTFAGNLIYAACLWGILSVLTKSGTPATVGRFALASAVATPFVMFASLQLRSVMAADARSTHDFRDYLALRLTLLPIAMIVLFAVASHYYDGEQIVAIMLFGAARCIDLIGDIYYGIAQKRDRMDIVATSRVAKGILALIFFGSVFRITGDLNWALGAMGLAWAIPLVVYDIPRTTALQRGTDISPATARLRWDHLTAILRLTLPLGFVILLVQMQQTIPRTTLEVFHGEETVGIYAALSYVVVAGSAVVMALGQSSLARLSKYFADQNLPAFLRLGKQLTLLGLAIGGLSIVGAAIGGRFFLAHIYAPSYGAHARLFVVIMSGGAMLYLSTLLAPMTTAMQAFRGQLVVQVISVSCLWGLSALLIPRHGMYGAAWSVLGASLGTAIGFSALIWLGIRRQRGRGPSWSHWLFH